MFSARKATGSSAERCNFLRTRARKHLTVEPFTVQKQIIYYLRTIHGEILFRETMPIVGIIQRFESRSSIGRERTQCNFHPRFKTHAVYESFPFLVKCKQREQRYFFIDHRSSFISERFPFTWLKYR